MDNVQNCELHKMLPSIANYSEKNKKRWLLEFLGESTQ
jgi:hypothetical protein